jgi:hypothetical protein
MTKLVNGLGCHLRSLGTWLIRYDPVALLQTTIDRGQIAVIGYSVDRARRLIAADKGSGMIKIIVLGLTMLAAPWAAWAQRTDQERAADTDIMTCQFKAAMELDDGVSGVNALAPVIADLCQAESDRLYRIMRGRFNGPIDEQAVKTAVREKDLRMASWVILTKRANDRKNAQNPPSDRKVGQTSPPEWATVISDAGGASYMNVNDVRKTSNGVSASVRVEFKQPMTLPSGKKYSLILQMSEYDCQGARYRPLSTSIYEDIGGKSPVTRDDSQGEWINITPGSLGEAESKIACLRR